MPAIGLGPRFAFRMEATPAHLRSGDGTIRKLGVRGPMGTGLSSIGIAEPWLGTIRLTMEAHALCTRGIQH